MTNDPPEMTETRNSRVHAPLKQSQRAIIPSMASILQIPTQDSVRRIQRIQAITFVWMSVEAAVSLSAAWNARSSALLAFGGDSAIELFSTIVVLWRFRAHPVQEHVERRAARIAGALLFVLAASVLAASGLQQSPDLSDAEGLGGLIDRATHGRVRFDFRMASIPLRPAAL